MEIRFIRLPGNRCEISVSGREGPDLRLPAVRVGHILPHDLMHAAVERALGLDDGLWGAIARGAMIDGTTFADVRQNGDTGMKKALSRGGDGIMDAEIKVNTAYRAWRGLPLPAGRAPAPLDAAELERAGKAIAEAAERWEGTPEGGALVWHW
ncbi:hypothetical protein [Actinocorallia populi]|uniref:hypothetical protein n=1 Tax=Actinocorallia populi TaxID=2079200 RepID=UPI0013008FF7|nr:hypothetical protein [Actinocorallia populi]